MSNALKIIPPSVRCAISNWANGQPDKTIFMQIRGKKLDLAGAWLRFLCHVRKKITQKKSANKVSGDLMAYEILEISSLGLHLSRKSLFFFSFYWYRRKCDKSRRGHSHSSLYELVRTVPRSYFRTRRVRSYGIEVNDRMNYVYSHRASCQFLTNFE